MWWTPGRIENKDTKNKVPDGQLGFEMPPMAKDVVAQLWVSGRSIATLPAIDPRYAHKTR